MKTKIDEGEAANLLLEEDRAWQVLLDLTNRDWLT